MITQCKMGNLPLGHWVGPFCISQCTLHIGNVWACKHTVIVILVSAPSPWSWVGDWGPKAWQLGLRYDIRSYFKSSGKNKEAWSYILYHFEVTFSLPLLITRMWQPCYLAAAECYSEIIDFTHSSDLVSNCIHRAPVEAKKEQAPPGHGSDWMPS